MPIEFKPSFYRRYVDDILARFESPESSNSLRECMSSKYKNIKFTVEHENIVSRSFSDVKICRKNGKFVTSVYRKQALSGVFTNYESFIPTYQRYYFIRVLAYVVISRHLISFGNRSFEDYPQENNYPQNFTDSCIKSFLNKLCTPKVIVQNVPERKSCHSFELLETNDSYKHNPIRIRTAKLKL